MPASVTARQLIQLSLQSLHGEQQITVLACIDGAEQFILETPRFGNQLGEHGLSLGGENE